MEYKIKYGPQGDERLVEWTYKKETDEVLEFDFDKSVIYDLGANIFDHSVYYAKKLPESTIYAFEPIKEYFDMGIKNMEDHNVKNIIPIMKGVGDVESTFAIGKHNEGSSLLRANDEYETEQVIITVLDQIIKEENLKIPTFIKIDVEGYEVNAIDGMLGVLENYKPALWIELHPHIINVDMEGMIKTVQQILNLGYGYCHFLTWRTELLFIHGKGETDIIPIIKNMYRNRRKQIRYLYDRTTSKEELQDLKKQFNLNRKHIKPLEWFIWSKLYRLFTFKKSI